MLTMCCVRVLPQMLVTMIDDDPFVGRIATGRISSGVVKVGDRVKIIRRDGASRISKTYSRAWNTPQAQRHAQCGMIRAVSIAAALQPPTCCDVRRIRRPNSLRPTDFTSKRIRKRWHRRGQPAGAHNAHHEARRHRIRRAERGRRRRHRVPGGRPSGTLISSTAVVCSDSPSYRWQAAALGLILYACELVQVSLDPRVVRQHR